MLIDSRNKAFIEQRSPKTQLFNEHEICSNLARSKAIDSYSSLAGIANGVFWYSIFGVFFIGVSSLFFLYPVHEIATGTFDWENYVQNWWVYLLWFVVLLQGANFLLQAFRFILVWLVVKMIFNSLKFKGVIAEGQIVGLEKADDSIEIAYRFEDKNGKVERKYNAKTPSDLTVGDRVSVLYLENDASTLL
jgi:hypothetical protein